MLRFTNSYWSQWSLCNDMWPFRACYISLYLYLLGVLEILNLKTSVGYLCGLSSQSGKEIHPRFPTLYILDYAAGIQQQRKLPYRVVTFTSKSSTWSCTHHVLHSYQTKEFRKAHTFLERKLITLQSTKRKDLKK